MSSGKPRTSLNNLRQVPDIKIQYNRSYRLQESLLSRVIKGQVKEIIGLLEHG